MAASRKAAGKRSSAQALAAVIAIAIAAALLSAYALGSQRSAAPGLKPYAPQFYSGYNYQYEQNNYHAYAINGSAGTFNISINGSIIVNPSYYDGEILAGLTYMSTYLGGMIAINSTTGNTIWYDALPNEAMTQPITIGNEAIIGLGNNNFKGISIRGNGTNYIAAISIRNGSLMWEFNTFGEDMPTPAYYNGIIVEPTGAGAVYGINAIAGSKVWNTSIPSFDSMSSPALLDGIAYFGGARPYRFYAINVSNGKVLWSDGINAYGGLDDCSPVIYMGDVITGYTQAIADNGYRLYIVAMNASNGKIVWDRMVGYGVQEPPQIAPPIEMPPLSIYNGMVLVEPTSSNTLYALNASDGNMLWDVYTGIGSSNVNVLDGYLIYVNYNGTAFAITANGSVARKSETGVYMGPGNPMVIGSHIVLFGINGVIKSIPANSIIPH